MKTKSTAKPRTVTIQLDAEMAGLLDAAMASHGSMSTPTQVVRSCCEAGLLRLVTACAHSPLAAIKEPAIEALGHVHVSRVESACSKVTR